jgi:hypothetical protein
MGIKKADISKQTDPWRPASTRKAETRGAADGRSHASAATRTASRIPASPNPNASLSEAVWRTILAVRDDLVGRVVRRGMLLTACGLAVSGTGLAVGALGASVIFKRDSAAGYAFIATTVLLTAYGLGRVVSPSLTRALASLPVIRAPEALPERQIECAQPVREG